MTETRMRKWFVAVLALLLAGPALFAQHVNTLPPEVAAAVDAAARADVERQQCVGAAVGVVRDGKIAYLKGYGFADREAKEPITGKTLFRWASVSKPITAVAAMQL